MQEVIKKAIELLESGTVNRVLGWKTGDFFYDLTPAVFESKEEIEKDFVFSPFCGANLSKYLIKESRKEGKVAVFLKPCDSYSFVQLLKEHRILRENVYAVGVACEGMCDIEKIKELGVKGITAVREDGEVIENSGRFDMVEKLEAMTAEERFEFWRGELSKCIRCNACRDVCPACTCEKCVFDNANSGVSQKAAATSFEENMYHIIRAFHVASRCTDCGECSRVCPQNIPLHLLNRKFIKDINEFYGEYQSGADTETRPPLMNFTKDDVEPSIVHERGGN